MFDYSNPETVVHRFSRSFSAICGRHKSVHLLASLSAHLEDVSECASKNHLRCALPRFFTLLLLIASQTAYADTVDDYIHAQMKTRGIPGLSLAIIQDGRIVKAKGYGVLEKRSKTSVTPSTLFQAASISKLVTATAALKLVEQGKLRLDEDVNAKLLAWKVPDNDFTKDQKVTLRRILNHTAGLTIEGFPGYARNEPIPTLTQILDGEKPANTPAIRVDTIPGSLWRYSGGGYVVLRQMLLDVTGKAFPEFMQETLLGPLGMNSSTFEQPLSEARAKFTAEGTYTDGNVVKGRWHVYPEMAPDGLWTTPSDLARFAIGLQQSVAGKPNSILSQTMIREMLTAQKNDDGLGAFLEDKGATLRFGHSGRNQGFDSKLIAYAETGQGAVIMINANETTGMTDRISKVIADAYHWPAYPRLSDIKRPPIVRMTAKALAEYQGRYEWTNNNIMTLKIEHGKLIARKDSKYYDELLPSGEGAFCSVDGPLQFLFAKNARGEITRFTVTSLTKDMTIGTPDTPRIGPLVHTLIPQPDPDSALTRKVEAVLKVFAIGGKALEQVSGITPGVRKDFSSNPLPEFAGIQTISFIASQDVADRGIERHGEKVSRILYYKLFSSQAPRYVLIYLTTDGLITDEDVVDD